MKTIVISESLHKELKILAAKESEQLSALVAKLLWKEISGLKL